jgi:AraC-like DNA-binding protein
MSKKKYSKIQWYERIVEAKLFMDSHCIDSINIGKIASKACFSKFHFLRMFKQTYRITPHRYLTILRIEKAKDLLRANTSITDICYLLGFESSSSFNRLFKRHVKLAPSVYGTYIRGLQVDIVEHPLAHVPLCFIDYMGWGK